MNDMHKYAEIYLQEVMNCDFTEYEERFSNLDWKEYKNLTMGDKTLLYSWLLKKELEGELVLSQYLRALDSDTRTYTVKLSKDGEERLFTRPKDAGEFLGVSHAKIGNNKGKYVNGWLVTACIVVETYNPFTGEILEREERTPSN